MKEIRSIILAAATLLCGGGISARAQYFTGTTITGGTNNVPASTTNSVSYIVPVTRSTAVALMPSFKLTGSGTTAVVFKFDQSIDLSTWKTAAVSVSVTPAGTSTVLALTNVTVDAIGYLRLSSIENPNSAAITNLVLKYATKRPQ